MITSINCSDALFAINTDSAPQRFAYQDLMNKMTKVMPQACEKKPDKVGFKGTSFIGCFPYIMRYGVGLARLNIHTN